MIFTSSGLLRASGPWPTGWLIAIGPDDGDAIDGTNRHDPVAGITVHSIRPLPCRPAGEHVSGDFPRLPERSAAGLLKLGARARSPQGPPALLGNGRAEASVPPGGPYP